MKASKARTYYMYYKDKIKSLKSIFGAENIALKHNSLIVGNKIYPIIDNVIILSRPGKYSDFVRKKMQLKSDTVNGTGTEGFAEDVQFSFGKEWTHYDKILPEHKKEFAQYFDIVDLSSLRSLRVCDLGCGNGRYSYYLKDICKEIILVDFSDAIFTARRNLSAAENCLFFMCDLKELPFKNDFCDFLFCLGVLQHMPTPCLDETRNLKRFAPRLLIYLYYALDNRPIYFHIILKMVIFLRQGLCKIRNPLFRKAFSSAAACLIYMPLIFLGRLLKPLKLGRYVPLYEFYGDKTIRRLQQDVYDTFFVRIEQRVSRKDILELQDTFASVIISDKQPYWHFLCERD